MLRPLCLLLCLAATADAQLRRRICQTNRCGDRIVIRDRNVDEVILVDRIRELADRRTFFFVAQPTHYGARDYPSPTQVAARDRDSRDKDDELGQRFDNFASDLTKRIDAGFRTVGASIEGIERRVKALEDRAPTSPPPNPAPSPGTPSPIGGHRGDPAGDLAAKTIDVSCSSCHQGADARKDYRVDLASVRSLRKGLAMVEAQKMPVDADANPIQLTPAEREKLETAFKFLIARYSDS